MQFQDDVWENTNLQNLPINFIIFYHLKSSLSQMILEIKCLIQTLNQIETLTYEILLFCANRFENHQHQYREVPCMFSFIIHGLLHVSQIKGQKVNAL